MNSDNEVEGVFTDKDKLYTFIGELAMYYKDEGDDTLPNLSDYMLCEVRERELNPIFSR
jgi:hypothetical protein